jgi:ABC-type multidrug transport system fused ATPase/permease subunit
MCTCRPGATFCGGVLDLTTTINTLGGTLVVSCAAPDSTTNAAQCDFQQSVLQSLFGASGLSLSGCTFGECVRQSVIDVAGTSSPSGNGTSKSSFGGGVIAGLAVVGSLVVFALLFLVYGIVKRRQARKSGPSAGMGKTGGVSVQWDNVNYAIPYLHRPWAGYNMSNLFGRKGYDGKGTLSEKTVLGGVSGRVEPGQMMAILGPSGKLGSTSSYDMTYLY